jgi:hypothetical protein
MTAMRNVHLTFGLMAVIDEPLGAKFCMEIGHKYTTNSA